MSFPLRFSSSLLALASMFAFAGCGDDDDDNDMPPIDGKAGQTHSHGGEASGGHGGASVEAGASECRVIGELCHEADTGNGPAHDCHELGHEADGAACLDGFAGRAAPAAARSVLATPSVSVAAASRGRCSWP